eukprot:s5548_g2.t1
MPAVPFTKAESCPEQEESEEVAVEEEVCAWGDDDTHPKDEMPDEVHSDDGGADDGPADDGPADDGPGDGPSGSAADALPGDHGADYDEEFKDMDADMTDLKKFVEAEHGKKRKHNEEGNDDQGGDSNGWNRNRNKGKYGNYGGKGYRGHGKGWNQGGWPGASGKQRIRGGVKLQQAKQRKEMADERKAQDDHSRTLTMKLVQITGSEQEGCKYRSVFGGLQACTGLGISSSGWASN